jgi:ubiquinone biosynthesis protein Coq4
LPNFKWRRRALPIHDLHHVIAGYEFSSYGEFEMSAWEFAAGPHVLSTLFCLPLVSMGAVVIRAR